MTQPADPGKTDTTNSVPSEALSEDISDHGINRQAAGEIRFRLTKLVLAIIAVVMFIIVMGDLRRRNVPLSQAQLFAEQLSKQQGESRQIPLNIRLELPVDLKQAFFSFTCLERTEARNLRDYADTAVLAYTRQVTRIILNDGRAAVTFKDGEIAATWLSHDQFDSLLQKQTAHIKSIPSG